MCKSLHKPFIMTGHHHFRNSLLNKLVHIPVFYYVNMSIFHAKMSMLGTFSIMPGTLKLKYIPVIIRFFKAMTISVYTY